MDESLFLLTVTQGSILKTHAYYLCLYSRAPWSGRKEFGGLLPRLIPFPLGNVKEACLLCGGGSNHVPRKNIKSSGW